MEWKDQMRMVKKITALMCAVILTAEGMGVPKGAAYAASVPAAEEEEITPLEFGETAGGRISSSEGGQQYQITLKSSGKLTIRLEGEEKTLAGRLTDAKGKDLEPREGAAGGTYTWQLKKGTYDYQVIAAKDLEIPPAGLTYMITANFKSAKAKYEGNTTRKKAAKLPLNRVIYGHLAQNAPSEYYKFTLKKMAPIAITLDTQIDEKTPETYVVSLYDKTGKLLGNWENPDWCSYESDAWYGSWIEAEGGTYQGLKGILEPGVYYVGVTVKAAEDGKEPKPARYGKFAIHATTWELPVSLKLSYNKAVYTGKKLKLPKITLTEYPDSPYYKDNLPYGKSRYDVEKYRAIYDLETGKFLRKVRKVGKYCFGRGFITTTLSTYNSDAYAIFTVTPVRGKIKRLSSRNAGQIHAVLRKDVPAISYEIQIARDKNFRKSKKTIKTEKSRETIKGLQSGRKYYVRVRNYKDMEIRSCAGANVRETIYGSWSRAKEIVCK